MAEGQPQPHRFGDSGHLARIVQELMDIYGYSPRELAKRADVGYHVIYGILHQSRRMRIDYAPSNLHGICHAFQLLPEQTARMPEVERTWREEARQQIIICAGFAPDELVQQKISGEFPIPKPPTPDQGSGFHFSIQRRRPADPDTEDLPDIPAFVPARPRAPRRALLQFLKEEVS